MLDGGFPGEERILQLHRMVHAMVHMQQFINKRNVKYEPYGPWGHFPKWMFGTKPCSVDSDSSTSDSDSDFDSNSDSHSSSNPNSNTDFDSGLSLTSCSTTLCCPNPTTHLMKSGLYYKQNAKRLETNVIGDGLPLTNLRNAKRLKTPTSWDWAPYDVGGQATKCDGGTDVVLWWGDWTYIVRHIAHPRMHSMLLLKKIRASL